MFRVETANGVGAIPFVDPSSASASYIRIKTQNYGVLAAHNQASLQEVLDDFEGSLNSAWSNETGGFSSGNISYSYNGSASLYSNVTDSRFMYADSGDYTKVQRGVVYSVWCYVSTRDRDIGIAFGYDGSSNDGYTAAWRSNDRAAGEDLFIGRMDNTTDVVGGNPVIIDKIDSIAKPTNQWIEFEIDFGDPITLNVKDVNGNVLRSVSGTDNTYNNQGTGFYANAGSGGEQAYDYMTVR